MHDKDNKMNLKIVLKNIVWKRNLKNFSFKDTLWDSKTEYAYKNKKIF